MNKLHMLALAGLLFSGVNNASMMGEEQMDMLYTLYALEQDPAQVPMIVQNCDMFIGIAEMHKQLKELKLKTATKELKTALWKNAALVGGSLIGKALFFKFWNSMDRDRAYFNDINKLVGYTSTSLEVIADVVIGLNIYHAWQNRSELIQALALDKEILSKLQEIKDSIDSSDVADNSVSPEKILLENAE